MLKKRSQRGYAQSFTCFVVCLGLTGVVLTGCGKAASSTGNNELPGASTPYQPANTSADALIGNIICPNEVVSTLPDQEKEALAVLNDTSIEVSDYADSARSKSVSFIPHFIQTKSKPSLSPFFNIAETQDSTPYEFIVTDNSGALYFKSQGRKTETVTFESNGTIKRTHSQRSGSSIMASYRFEYENVISDALDTYPNSQRKHEESVTIATRNIQQGVIKFYSGSANPLTDPQAIPTGIFTFSNGREYSMWDYPQQHAKQTIDYSGTFAVKDTHGNEYTYALHLTQRQEGTIVNTPINDTTSVLTISGNNNSNFFLGKLIKDGKVVGILKIKTLASGSIVFRIIIFDQNGRPVLL